jgi:hypothetical protein
MPGTASLIPAYILLYKFVFNSPLELTEESMIGEEVFREDCLSVFCELLTPSLGFALRAMLRMFKIVPNDFVRNTLFQGFRLELLRKFTYGAMPFGYCALQETGLEQKNPLCTLRPLW